MASEASTARVREDVVGRACFLLLMKVLLACGAIVVMFFLVGNWHWARTLNFNENDSHYGLYLGFLQAACFPWITKAVTCSRINYNTGDMGLS
jgi:hypothetical protein